MVMTDESFATVHPWFSTEWNGSLK